MNMLLFQQLPVPASATSVVLPETLLRKITLSFELLSTLIPEVALSKTWFRSTSAPLNQGVAIAWPLGCRQRKRSRGSVRQLTIGWTIG